MKKASPDSPSYLDRIRSWARTKAHGPSPLSAESNRSSVLPLSNPTSTSKSSVTRTGSNYDSANLPPFPSTDANGLLRQSSSKPTVNKVADNTSSDSPPPAPPPEGEGQGTVVETEPKKNIAIRFFDTSKNILLSSWINVLLIFVPVGIAVDVAKLNPTIVFVMNAIAIVPLAGLLSHATESVAKRMGDTIGALMNITFGNAVELIIFMYVYLSGDQDKKEREALLQALSYQSRPISSDTFSSHVPYSIALSKDEIRIVQASLLGSILANLLLILGMCFLFGGLKFREQMYNSTVTQMSACLLSLSVMSLLLPTAFHASFTDYNKADEAVLKVSRGTSVILLLVYVLYLLFQLKSHAYMYESTPQHIIDEESAPGPIAAWMDSSSSDEDSPSSSDSDDSRGSNTTAGRLKRVMRGGKRHRKSSAGSKDADQPGPTRTSSYSNASPILSDILSEEPSISPTGSVAPHRFGAIEINEDADDEVIHGRKSRPHSFSDRKLMKKEKKAAKKRQEKEEKRRRKDPKQAAEESNEKVSEPMAQSSSVGMNEPRRVDFAVQTADVEVQPTDLGKKPFALRNLNIRPAIPKTFSQTVFSSGPQSGAHRSHGEASPVVTGPIPRVRYGIRRTNSLPDRLNQVPSGPHPSARINSTLMQSVPSNPLILNASMVEGEENISRTTAVILLLVSTGLVALCAEFMVSSINSVTQNTVLGETFVGLIIVPIVGNAAEHVTAVTVAHKNKMDLALGVAVGSSIQIALFVTPFVVLLGWCMNKDMSLYFTLFETVSLFVSVFVVNFLVLDGRSNYLEGALLCSAYVIIAVAAFFYPKVQDQSVLGGNAAASGKMIRSLVQVAGQQIGVNM